tara:strand:+ start:7002 stop:7589 length:588 start_codon:yes stop_codon:yes gene_type:complete
MIKKKYNLFFFLSFLMAFIVITSNYLVQFPINYYNLQELLTYGAFTYPITFLVTDMSNKAYGKELAKKIVYLGFIVGVLITLFLSTNFEDLISIRIAFGSGIAFLFAQILDVQIFDKLRNSKKWFIAPLTSSIIGSAIDTMLFFTISFYNTEVPWVSLAFGDFLIKILIAIIMLIPFRIFLKSIMKKQNKVFSYK